MHFFKTYFSLSSLAASRFATSVLFWSLHRDTDVLNIKCYRWKKTFWLYVISDLRNITDLHICVERGEIQPQSWKLLMRNRAQWGCDTRSEQIRNRRKSLTFLLSVLKSRVYRWVQTIFRFQMLNSGIMDVKFNWNCKCDRKSQKIYLWWDYSDWASKHNQTDETAFCLRFD